MPDIKIRKPAALPISELKFDEKNPNIMSEEQEAALGKSMQEYGFVEALIVGKKEKDGKRIVYNGNHRLKQLQKSNAKQVYAYVLEDLTDIQLRILRQTTNKLHGAHDFELDRMEIQDISDNNQLELLGDLIATPPEILLPELFVSDDDDISINAAKKKDKKSQTTEQIDSTDRNADGANYTHSDGKMEKSAHHALSGQVKHMLLIYPNDVYVDLHNRMKAIAEIEKTANNSETIIRLIEYYEKNNSKAKP